MARTTLEEDMADSRFVQHHTELLTAAIHECNAEGVDAVLSHCGNLAKKVVNSRFGPMNLTPLHIAAAKGMLYIYLN